MRCTFGVAAIALCLTGSSAVSCSPCRVGGQDPVPYTDGETNESLTVYQTGAVDAPMLHFPQGRVYDLHHGLGTTPVSVNVYLSFRERLTSSGNKDDKTEPNNVAESAGNQAVIERWDDEVIRVRNDTCAEFYLRVVVLADPDLASVASLGGSAGAPSN